VVRSSRERRGVGDTASGKRSPPTPAILRDRQVSADSDNEPARIMITMFLCFKNKISYYILFSCKIKRKTQNRARPPVSWVILLYCSVYITTDDERFAIRPIGRSTIRENRLRTIRRADDTSCKRSTESFDPIRAVWKRTFFFRTL